MRHTTAFLILPQLSTGFSIIQDKFYGEEGISVCNFGNSSVNVDNIFESTVVDCGNGKQVNLLVHDAEKVFGIDVDSSKFSRTSKWSEYVVLKMIILFSFFDYFS